MLITVILQHFNTYMVRLKVVNMAGELLSWEFQYLYGAIKREGRNEDDHLWISFNTYMGRSKAELEVNEQLLKG